VKEIHAGNNKRGFHRNADKGMRNAAMMLKRGDRAAQAPQCIDVRKLGPNGHRQRGVGRTAVQAAPRQACTRKNVGDRLHGLKA